MQNPASENIKENDNLICSLCNTQILKPLAPVLCPKCQSPYHNECWTKHNGCSKTGCNYSIVKTQNIQECSFYEILVNAEYLRNRNKLSEAITECNRILNADPLNTEAKRLYNECTQLLNAKMKLLEDGDDSFSCENFKEAEIYFKNALQYADDVEADMLNTKIEIIRQRIPFLRKKKNSRRFIIFSVVFVLLLIFSYGVYYFFFLKEFREYNKIKQKDSTGDLQIMEQQVSAYEKFLIKYSGSKFREEIENKISQYSALVVAGTVDLDWRLSQEFLPKINEKETKGVLFKKILDNATAEYKANIQSAKKFNKNQEYDDAKSSLEKANAILDYFTDSDLYKNKSKVSSAISLLERKRKSFSELKSIETKIKELNSEIKKIKSSSGKDYIVLEGKVIFKYNDSSRIIIKKEKKLYSVIGDVVMYSIGENVLIYCTENGTFEYKDKEIKEYTTSSELFQNEDKEKKESCQLELSNLSAKKQKLDSILNINLSL